MRKKTVFISYNHGDSEVADKLKAALEKNDIEVRIDQAMDPGANIQQFIEASIRGTDVTLSIVSNRSLKSAWVAMESITTFYSEKFQNKKFIACYIDDEFFQIDYESKAIDRIDQKIAEIDRLAPIHSEKKIDTVSLNNQKTRLFKLRNNLGEILQRLTESLVMDIRDDKFDESVKRVVRTIKEMPDLPDPAPAPGPPSKSPLSYLGEMAPTRVAGDGRPITNLALKRNKFFTGRDDILKGLNEGFKKGETVQALNGLGGLGKTQTAIEYAYRYREDYRYVWWGSANTRELLVKDFVGIAAMLDLPEKDSQDQGETVKAVMRRLEGDEGWLLILDNADDLTVAREFIPSSEGGHVLLTTRAKTTGTLAVRNCVAKMEPAEGATFLLRRLGKLKKGEPLESAADELRREAEALSRELGGLPLALDQAAAFIDERNSSLGEYLALYRDERAELLARRGELASDHPSVAVTFSLAFKKVGESSVAAADLLRVCAFLEADSIPEEIFGKGGGELGEALGSAAGSPLKLTDAIAEAGRYSLLERNPETKTVRLHRLVQEVLKAEMAAEGVDRIWAERAIRAVNAVFPYPEFANWEACGRLTPHVQKLAESIEKYGFEFGEASRMLNQAGYYLRGRAQYKEAEPLYRRALKIDEESFDPDHPNVAIRLNNLAALLHDTNRLGEAEPLMRRALQIDEDSFGPDHPNVARDLNNLAALLQATKRLGETEPLMWRVVEILLNFTRATGHEHPNLRAAIGNYLGLLGKMGYSEEKTIATLNEIGIELG